MRNVDTKIVTEKIAQMVQNINYAYPKDIYAELVSSYKKEQVVQAKRTLGLLLENATLANEKKIPICQDTGMVIVFAKVGQEVHFSGGNFNEAIQEGVRIGYQDGYLRKSIVDDPVFERINTKDNTPAIIYTEITSGDQIILEVSAKGFGSENMSKSRMLKPAQGKQGICDFVLECIREAGPNACPPYVIGVGIGGSFDYAAVLAKKATLRDINTTNENPKYQKLEEELLASINELQIGPQGLKGDTSAFGLNIEYYPTHIAGLPCAVNISCHITRHAKEII